MGPRADTSAAVDDPGRAGELIERPRGRASGATAHPPAGRHLGGLGGRRRAAGPARRLPARLPRAPGRVRLRTRPRSTATSARAACTPGSRSSCAPPTGSPITARSWSESADLVVRYGGSLSGEHGDGQSRGELLPHDVRRRADRRAFGELKALFDPDDRMNPGKVVHPNPLDSDLRLGAGFAPTEPRRPVLLPQGRRQVLARRPCAASGSASAAATSGGGDVPVVPGHPRGGALDPRARAAAVRDDAGRRSITDGWQSTEVRDALDLCLACKGCKSDCPVNVDMATYKAEFLAHHYARPPPAAGALLDGLVAAAGRRCAAATPPP